MSAESFHRLEHHVHTPLLQQAPQRTDLNIAFGLSLAEGLLHLPHLTTLYLDGFTSHSPTLFKLSRLIKIRSLHLRDCTGLDGLLCEQTPTELVLSTLTPDRPIDMYLTEKQWDELETLSLNGPSFYGGRDSPVGIIHSLMVSSHQPRLCRA